MKKVDLSGDFISVYKESQGEDCIKNYKIHTLESEQFIRLIHDKGDDSRQIYTCKT